MSSFASYCLNCGEAIRRIEYDEVAFCSLACQTRALLVVADAQQQEAITSSGRKTEHVSKAYIQEQDSTAERQSDRQSGALAKGGETPVSSNRPKLPKLSRPPLHTRHSVAVVNNLVSSSIEPLEHPMMSSLRSDIFSISSVARPLVPASRPPPASASGAPGSATNGILTMSPKCSTNQPHVMATSRTASPSFFPAPLLPHGHATDVPTTAEALYRQHYPKFANRRHLRDQSPNKYSPRMSDSRSTSTVSDLQLLTPPSALRPLVVLPEGFSNYSSIHGVDPPPPTPKTDVKMDSMAISPDVRMAAPDLPELVPSLSTPSLRQTPERRSAPRRSLEMSPSISHDYVTGLQDANKATNVPSPNILRPPLQPNGPNAGRKTDLSVVPTNSLGLAIDQAETAGTPGSTSSAFSPDAKENNEPSKNKALSSVSKTKGTFPASPPKARSRIVRMHTAPLPAHNGMAGQDGWSSVEASRYTLGPREASYIVRKLSEEQKIRQQKERAAARDEAMETRGRSRVRKRAGSWGNPVSLPNL